MGRVGVADCAVKNVGKGNDRLTDGAIEECEREKTRAAWDAGLIDGERKNSERCSEQGTKAGMTFRVINIDRVARGDNRRKQADIRCRGNEESNHRILSGTMDETNYIGLIIFSMKEISSGERLYLV